MPCCGTGRFALSESRLTRISRTCQYARNECCDDTSVASIPAPDNATSRIKWRRDRRRQRLHLELGAIVTLSWSHRAIRNVQRAPLKGKGPLGRGEQTPLAARILAYTLDLNWDRQHRAGCMAHNAFSRAAPHSVEESAMPSGRQCDYVDVCAPRGFYYDFYGIAGARLNGDRSGNGWRAWYCGWRSADM